MGVSKNRGGKNPKWMVKIMEKPKENLIKMDDLGGKYPYFWFNTHINWPTCVEPTFSPWGRVVWC